MDDRFRARREGVRRIRGRRRLLLVLAAACVVLAAAAFLWLRASDVFAVTHVLLPQTEHMSADDVRRRLQDVRGESLLRVSTEDLGARLHTMPYVKSAEVHRHFPHSLEVEIVERTPVAELTDADGSTWLVSSDGHVLERLEDDSGAEGPAGGGNGLVRIVPGYDERPEAGSVVASEIEGALTVVRFLRTDEELGTTFDAGSIRVEAGGAVTLVLSSGAEIRMGIPEQVEEKLRVAAEIVDHYSRDGQALAYVDVRTPAKAVAKAVEP